MSGWACFVSPIENAAIASPALAAKTATYAARSRADTARGYPGPTVEPSAPFSPPPGPTGRPGARILWAEVATIAIVAGTAIALLLYFLLR